MYGCFHQIKDAKELKRKIIKESKKYMKVIYNWNERYLLWMVPFYASNLQVEVSLQCIYIYTYLKMDGIGNNILPLDNRVKLRK